MNTIKLHTETITHITEMEHIIPVGGIVKRLHNDVTDESFIEVAGADYVSMSTPGSVTSGSVAGSYNTDEQNLKDKPLVDQNGDTYKYFEQNEAQIETRYKFKEGQVTKYIGVVELDASNNIISATSYRQVTK